MLLIPPPPPFYFLSLLKIRHRFEVGGHWQLLTCSQGGRGGSPGLPSCASSGGMLAGPAGAPQCHKASPAPAQPAGGSVKSRSEQARTQRGAFPQETCPGKTCHSCPAPVWSFGVNCLALKSGSGGSLPPSPLPIRANPAALPPLQPAFR